MYIASDWKDYECIDCGEGHEIRTLGRNTSAAPRSAGNFRLQRGKDKAGCAVPPLLERGGQWEYYKSLPESWTVSWRELTFKVRPMGFKHTGLFPEQAANWDWMMRLISSCGRPVKVLNLLGTTGALPWLPPKRGASGGAMWTPQKTWWRNARKILRFPAFPPPRALYSGRLRQVCAAGDTPRQPLRWQ